MAAFQLINLPVEFDASNRAKRLLVEYGIVRQPGNGVRQQRAQRRGVDLRGRHAAGGADVLYYVMRFAGGSSDE